MPAFSSFAAISGRALGLNGGSSASSITDNFNRTNSSTLGLTSDGRATWSVVSGAFSIDTNRVVPTTSQATSGIAVIEFANPNVNISASVGYGGDCIYFRVADSNNWWRAGTSNTTTYYPIYQTVYNYQQDMQGVCLPAYGGFFGCYADSCHGGHSSQTTSNTTGVTPTGAVTASEPGHSHTITYSNCSGGASISFDNQAHNHASGSWYSTGTTLQYLGSVAATEYFLLLEKCVGGSVTTISNLSLSTTIPTSIQLTANGSAISVRYNGNISDSITTTDSHNLTSTRHGLGRRSYGTTSSEGIDDWTCSIVS